MACQEHRKQHQLTLHYVSVPKRRTFAGQRMSVMEIPTTPGRQMLKPALLLWPVSSSITLLLVSSLLKCRSANNCHMSIASIMWHHVTTRDIVWHHVTSCDITWDYVTWCLGTGLWVWFYWHFHICSTVSLLIPSLSKPSLINQQRLTVCHSCQAHLDTYLNRATWKQQGKHSQWYPRYYLMQHWFFLEIHISKDLSRYFLLWPGTLVFMTPSILVSWLLESRAWSCSWNLKPFS